MDDILLSFHFLSPWAWAVHDRGHRRCHRRGLPHLRIPRHAALARSLFPLLAGCSLEVSTTIPQPSRAQAAAVPAVGKSAEQTNQADNDNDIRNKVVVVVAARLISRSRAASPLAPPPRHGRLRPLLHAAARGSAVPAHRQLVKTRRPADDDTTVSPSPRIYPPSLCRCGPARRAQHPRPVCRGRSDCVSWVPGLKRRGAEQRDGAWVDGGFGSGRTAVQRLRHRSGASEADCAGVGHGFGAR
jgi:hypothetical protein